MTRRTWEWLPGAQIRSCLHPLLFAGLYHLLKASQCSSPLSHYIKPYQTQPPIYYPPDQSTTGNGP